MGGPYDEDCPISGIDLVANHGLFGLEACGASRLIGITVIYSLGLGAQSLRFCNGP